MKEYNKADVNVRGKAMEQLGISKLDLKRQNRMFILNTIKNRGPISRVDIAMLLELTRAAVTIITNEMISQGILFEAGEAPNSGEKTTKGRKKILIDINRNYKFAFGVSVENDLMSVGLSTLFGDVLDKKSTKLEGGCDFDEITGTVVTACEDILRENYLTKSDVIGLGIGVHPTMYNVLKIADADDGLHCEELTETLSTKLSVPVACENFVSILALANMEFKPEEVGKRPEGLCLIHCGSTFDAAIIKKNDYEDSISRKTNIIEKIIINNKKDRIGDGTVKSELTLPAMRQKLEMCCTEAQIISIYNEMINRSASGTLPEMLDNIAPDDKTHMIIKESIEEFAVLLCNIYTAQLAQKIFINRYYLQNVDLDQLIQLILKNSPVDLSNVLAASKFTGKFSFLGGCSLAVYKFFFHSGGLNSSESADGTDYDEDDE